MIFLPKDFTNMYFKTLSYPLSGKDSFDLVEEMLNI